MFLVIVGTKVEVPIFSGLLGNLYTVISTDGRLKEANYDFTHEFLPGKQTKITQLINAISNHPPNNIFLATENDDQGELIAMHVCDVAKLNPHKVKRVRFSELTRRAVLHSFAHPDKIDLNRAAAQIYREQLEKRVQLKTKLLAKKSV